MRRGGPAQPTVAAGGGRGGSDDLGAVEVSCPGGQSHTWGREREQSEKSEIYTYYNLISIRAPPIGVKLYPNNCDSTKMISPIC